MRKNELTFHKNLKALRKANKLTQEKMGELLYCSRPIIGNWEKGISAPDIFTLDAICNYFNVSAEQILYGKIAPEEPYQNLSEAELQGKVTGEEKLVCLLEKDIGDMLPPTDIDFGTIIVIAQALNRAGYEVTEVFPNGLSVFVKTKEEESRLSSILYEVGDAILHSSEEWLIKRRVEVENRVWEVKEQLINETMTQILGKSPQTYSYCWYDEENNIRGYADSQEECKRQAQHQACRKYRIEETESV